MDDYGKGANAPQVLQGKPVTLNITDNLDSMGSLAHEINARLMALRDRLLGSPPPSTVAAGGNHGLQPTPGSFAEAAEDGLCSLRMTLNSIDALSNIIASRL